MTREEAVTVLKAFMENPLFSDVHKAAFNIAIHDIKQRHDWDINKLMLVPKTEWEQEPTTKDDLPHCRHTDKEIAKSFIEDVEAVKDQLPTTKNDLGVDTISREQALNEFCIYNSYDSIGVDKVRSYLKALPSVTPQEPRWIPVNERLPEYMDTVLTWDGGAFCIEKRIPYILDADGEPVKSDWWVGDEYVADDFDYYPNLRDGAPIAWMPLPKPYEPQESEDKE